MSEKRLKMELNRVTVYLTALAQQTKNLDTVPEGFRDTIRKVVEDATEVLGS